MLVTARQIAMYLCRELTDLSLPKIGQLFGGRDHTTVMHADRKIRQLLGERRSVFNQVTELTNRIKQSRCADLGHRGGRRPEGPALHRTGARLRRKPDRAVDAVHRWAMNPGDNPSRCGSSPHHRRPQILPV